MDDYLYYPGKIVYKKRAQKLWQRMLLAANSFEQKLSQEMRTKRKR